MNSSPTEQAARRFTLATRIAALADGAQIIVDNLAAAEDDLVVQALEKLEAEAKDIAALATVVRDVAQFDRVEAEDV